MLRRVLLYSGIILFFLIAILIMTAGNYIKHPFTESETLSSLLEELDHFIAGENWEQASKALDEMESTWNKLSFYVQFSSERDEVRRLEEQFLRLRAAIKYENQLQAEMERALVGHTLRNLGN